MLREPSRKTASGKPPAVVVRGVRSASSTFTESEAAAMARPHKPEAFLVCCIDSRFQPAKALDYGPGVALEHRPIACVIPPEDKASEDFLARMAFRRLNNIRTITLVCHSDCGGIQAALRVPAPNDNRDDDLHAVAAVVHQSGLDLGRLGPEFLAAEKGDLRRAGDRLSRAVAVKSLENLMGYKGGQGHATISGEVSAGALNVMLLYYDLEKRRFEVYDAAARKWRTAADSDTLFLRDSARPKACGLHGNCAHK